MMLVGNSLLHILCKVHLAPSITVAMVVAWLTLRTSWVRCLSDETKYNEICICPFFQRNTQ